MHYRSPIGKALMCGASPLTRALVALAAVLALLLPCTAPSIAAGVADGENTLDVGLVIFDPGIPADASTHSKLGIFPEIRKAEAKYMPVMLRERLVSSGEWGVVRVLPEPQDSSELLVTGTIVHSDGQLLELQIQARDATGEQWFDKRYTGTTSASDYPVKVPGDPFAQVYAQIAADLLAARQQKSAAELAQIRQVALMRYAVALAPDVFASYLSTSPEGRFTLLRLPAEDDPMLVRVMRVREQEYLFIDTVDEQYARLGEQMAPTYNLWRQYGAEQAEYRDEYQAKVSSRDSQGRRGSFAALEQTYNAYKWSKIHEQDLDELALGFNNEVAPTEMQVSGTVFKLSGSLNSQYAEWREILQRIFLLETGMPPGP
ncbi:MAG: hypothetical protein R3E64_10215 [Halioglobus sp.]